MTDVMSMEVKGIEELQEKMSQVVKDLGGAPAINAMRDCTLKVQRDAKIFAPVDTGRLRASIMPEVKTHTETIEGVVGSNVIYSPYQELGTGIYAGSTESYAGSFAMMTAMGAKGGIRPRRYLARALENNREYIKKVWEGIVGRIVRK